jgi:HEAT repeat protein
VRLIQDLGERYLMAFKPPNFNGILVPYGASVIELAAMIELPGPQRWAAYIALAHDESEEGLGVLAKATQRSDPHTRRAALAAIGQHVKGHTLADLVHDGLEDPSDFVARTACEAAAALRLHGAHDAVFRLLDDKSLATRIVAIQTLKVLWNDLDFTKLHEIVQDKRNERLRKEAAFTLRARASESNWHQLFDTWREDSLPRHRTWACQLAELFGGSQAMPILTKLAKDHNGHVRKAAARAIAAIADRRPDNPTAG